MTAIAPLDSLHITVTKPAVSPRIRAVLVNVIVLSLLCAAAVGVRHIGSIPGVFNGADLLAVILLAVAVIPARRAGQLLRRR